MFRLVEAVATVLLLAWLVQVGPRPASAQGGTPLVSETFTGATADPRFEGFGSACLTGAPAGTPGTGDHPLGGCPVGGVNAPPTSAAPLGYLQLTDASHDQAGAVLFNQPIPANEGLEVSFEQWQYGSTTSPNVADGISFFLVDGAGGLTAPGAFGGSLGYAQKIPDDNPANGFLPGVDNGYLGIGLDTLGNYFGDWEHRGNGCDTRSPAGTSFRIPGPGANMVTVRGPGNGTDGYCFLTATTSNFSTNAPWPSTLPGTLQGPLASMPAGVTPAQAQTLLEPSRRTITIRITPAPDPVVTVLVDFHDGTGTHQVLQFAGPTQVPPTYKLGFAASTGGFTDVHLIRNLHVSSLLALPKLNLVKQVVIDPPLPDVIGLGTQIPYEFVVTNGGTTPISALAVADAQVPGISCPDVVLAPDETVVCTGSHTVTQPDVDAGVVVNTAIATGTSDSTPVTSPPSEAEVPLGHGSASLSLTKFPTPSGVSRAGQDVEYSYVVTNTGTLTLDNLRVADTTFSGTGTPPVVDCPNHRLAPAEHVICTGTYTVTQEDIDAHTPITNTALAHATAPDGTPEQSNPAPAAVDIVAVASLAVVKSALPSTVTTAGEVVSYSFLVVNDGNVPVTDLTIADTSTGTGTLSPIVCDAAELAAGASTTCRATYAVTAADIAAGGVRDTATATAHGPDGAPTTSPPADAVVDTVLAPGLSLTKIAEPVSLTEAGQTITYDYVVTNSGDFTLTGLTVTDTAFSGSGTPPTITCDIATLTPGQQVICTGSYTVTQEDVDSGQVTDTATATGTPPTGPAVTSPESDATVEIPPLPSLALVKSADPTAVTAAGEFIAYAFLVTNNGNVTIDHLRVRDTDFSGSGGAPAITCPATTLAPGEETTCTATYTVTQADIDAGHVSNTAVASGTGPDGEAAASPPSDAFVPAEVFGLLRLEKSAEPTTVAGAGAHITFTFVATNIGTEPLTDIAIHETDFTGTGQLSALACPSVMALAVGASLTCTADYITTAEDAAHGSVSNEATATGKTEAGETVTSPPARATVTVTAPALPATGTGAGPVLLVAGVCLVIGGALRIAGTPGLIARRR
jgi:Bacterial lectin/Domain of unknown function DUF11